VELGYRDRIAAAQGRQDGGAGELLALESGVKLAAVDGGVTAELVPLRTVSAASA
jgi:hypothetical protein